MWIEGSTRRVDALMSNVQLVSGIVYVGLFFVAAASVSVLATSVEFSDGDIDPVTAHQFPVFGSSVLVIFALRMAAMFVFTTSTIGRTSGVVPRWFALSGYVVGIFLLLTAALQTWFVFVFPIWLLLFSAILLPACSPDPTRSRPASRPRSVTADHATTPDHCVLSGRQSKYRQKGWPAGSSITRTVGWGWWSASRAPDATAKATAASRSSTWISKWSILS